jgi:hypothetical protein
MRWFTLLLTLMLSGCYLPASTTLVHPETHDVQYCWQHTVILPMNTADAMTQAAHPETYAWIRDSQRPDPECMARWQARGYRVTDTPPAPGERTFRAP